MVTFILGVAVGAVVVVAVPAAYRYLSAKYAELKAKV